ncbi:tRNA lysidine(34) synthetase TilS [Tenuifilum thalassicum]|nr:tRNA lysidine(34) synthetase TilS [Tenuifilum thalassicum]
MLKSKFLDFISEHNLFSEHDKLLVGVSGGIDSMVLLHLLVNSGFNVGVSHCNFNLRGEESDADEQFVRYHCLMNGIPIHTIAFDTKQYALENGLSIQVAARELRYNYFDEICKEHKYSHIAIAHNLNDSVETVLLNLARGTGLKGLTGIKPVNGKIIRPLLFATRSQIADYAKENNISFREDSSNASTKYKRNFIRHKVMPLLRELNPSADYSIYNTAQHLNEAQILVERQLAQIQEDLISVNDDKVLIDIEKLLKESAGNYFLVNFLATYGFTPFQAAEAYKLTASSPGSRVESESHVVYRDRSYLILQHKQLQNDDVGVTIAANDTFIESPVKLSINIVDYTEGYTLEKDMNVANLDFQKLKFPLTIRKWKPGDRFVPFGMKGFKKVSDFLVDNKVPLADKNNVYVLTTAGEIAWVIGYRIDNRFSLSESSNKIFKIKLLVSN